MRIILSPQCRGDSLSLSVAGDVLTINGTAYDLSPLQEGDVLPASALSSEFVTGNVTRVGGEVQITVILPITPDAPRDACFPEPIVTTSANPVILPMVYT